jgi:dihydrofolate reductase
MGKIVSYFFISLDDVVEAPDQWHFPYFNDEMGAAVSEGMGKCAAFLMGRRMYDEWSKHWPAVPADSEEGQIAAFFNDIPKYVISDSLTEATWNNTTIISGDVKAKVQQLKDDIDGDINMSGSTSTVRWLLTNGLVDELDLLVHPIVVGAGDRLFDGVPKTPLKLLRSETFSTGVLRLVYAPESEAE